MIKNGLANIGAFFSPFRSVIHDLFRKKVLKIRLLLSKSEAEHDYYWIELYEKRDNMDDLQARLNGLNKMVDYHAEQMEFWKQKVAELEEKYVYVIVYFESNGIVEVEDMAFSSLERAQDFAENFVGFVKRDETSYSSDHNSSVLIIRKVVVE